MSLTRMSDTMNAAQMQSLGGSQAAQQNWPMDEGYNSGGLKCCGFCAFTCDFTDDLLVHQARRHVGQGPLPLGERHYIPGVCSNNPVEFGFSGFASQVSTVDRVVGRTRSEIEQRIARLEEERKLSYSYLSAKLAAQDMERVALAAKDIREVNAQLEVLRWVLAE
jgi:hypothetical protein